MLDSNPPKLKIPESRAKHCGRVTSADNLRILVQKEKEKQEKQLTRELKRNNSWRKRPIRKKRALPPPSILKLLLPSGLQSEVMI